MTKIARVSLAFLILLGFLALSAPWIAPYSYEEQNIDERLEPPSAKHWMGTDMLGRDSYSRLLYGARISLSIGVLTALMGLILGTVTGLVSGYFGGLADRILMRIVDGFYIFPSMLLAILVTLWVGRGFTGILLALGVSTWVGQARLVRAMTLQIREMPYIEAAKNLGMSQFRIVFRHVFPNLLGPVVIALMFQVPQNIMAESFLSFIGLGLEPPISSWGTLAQEGFRAMRSFPHLILFPGIALFFTMLAFQFLGDALRDRLDPKSILANDGK